MSTTRIETRVAGARIKVLCQVFSLGQGLWLGSWLNSTLVEVWANWPLSGGPVSLTWNSPGQRIWLLPEQAEELEAPLWLTPVILPLTRTIFIYYPFFFYTTNGEKEGNQYTFSKWKLDICQNQFMLMFAETFQDWKKVVTEILWASEVMKSYINRRLLNGNVILVCLSSLCVM